MSERALTNTNSSDRGAPRKDVRRLPRGSAPDAIATARREIDLVNEHDLILARALAAIERERAFAAFGCTSAEHWAVMQGLDRGRAKELLNLGRLMKAVPETEKDVLEGVLTPQSAAVVGRLIKPTPALPPSDEPDPAEMAAREAAEAERARKYAEVAKTMPNHKLRRLVNQEKERVKQQDRVVSLVFHVKQSAKDDWLLARKIASRRAKRHLTDGEAFTLVVADYVKLRDKDGLSGRKTTGKRRMGPTSERPGDRTIPAEVRREAMARACGHCEFPGCSNGTFLQLCHIRAHTDKGDREVSNLVVLCSPHHAMLDCSWLRLFERTERGVTFVDTRTGELFQPRPALSAADVLPEVEVATRPTSSLSVGRSSASPGAESAGRWGAPPAVRSQASEPSHDVSGEGQLLGDEPLDDQPLDDQPLDDQPLGDQVSEGALVWLTSELCDGVGRRVRFNRVSRLVRTRTGRGGRLLWEPTHVARSNWTPRRRVVHRVVRDRHRRHHHRDPRGGRSRRLARKSPRRIRRRSARSDDEPCWC